MPNCRDRYSSDETHRKRGYKSMDPLPVLQSLIVAKAAALARRGRLVRAEQFLSPLVNSGQPSAEAIDLLAKIYAQQGMMEEARDLWKRASAMDPLNTEPVKALERCNQIRQRNFYSFRVSILGPLVFTLLFSCALLALNVYYLPAGGRAFLSPRGEDDIAHSSAASTLAVAPGSEANTAFPPAEASIPTPAPPTPSLESFPELCEPVRKALGANTALAPLALSVVQNDADIRVVGEVPNLETRYLVETTVRNVPGVERVDLSDLRLGEIYEVQAGDTLWFIAKRAYGNPSLWNLIAESNQISAAESLRVGQKLYIPRIQKTKVE